VTDASIVEMAAPRDSVLRELRMPAVFGPIEVVLRVRRDRSPAERRRADGGLRGCVGAGRVSV